MATNIPKKKTPGPDGFTGLQCEIFKGEIILVLHIFKKMKAETHSFFYETATSKRKDITGKLERSKNPQETSSKLNPASYAEFNIMTIWSPYQEYNASSTFEN